MPIPSLTSSLKSKGLLGKPKDTTSSAETRRPPSSSNSVSRTAQQSSLPQPSDVDGPRRRSLLPQRGTSISLPRGSGIDATKAASSATGERLRPRSMYQTTSSARIESHADMEKAPSTRSTQAQEAIDRAAMPPPPPPTGLSRTQSLRRPTLPTQQTQPPVTRGHSRAQSTSTVARPRTGSIDTRSRAERPKSLVVSSDSMPPPAPPSSNVASAGTRSSTRLAALQRPRSASTRAKPEAADKAEHSAATRAGEPSTSDTRRRLPSRDEPKKPSRPAFNTMQQHFTPRKTAKAPTATFLHPAAESSGHTLPPEIVSLQAELLQLHLLHEASAEVNRQWELSAKRSLHHRFDEVASLYQVMRESERQGQEQKNLESLREWNNSNSSSGLAEHIQVLSGPLHELPSLVDSGGRFRRLVDDFERWASWVDEIQTARGHAANGRSADTGSVEGLGDAWQAENAALTRKLTAYSRDLDKLTQPAPGSSLSCIVATCKELLRGILEELRTMQMIHAGVVAQESEWVEDRLKSIARDIGAHLAETAGGNEAWRV
ncbi:hypothetical protein BS50DRAFT_591408 [Corynespora cassiicola Philippines]|uniref:Uncharacterized protein n=1 Tax=Corynespora cassiicola Philippines TaxID=1448308 RepID=A0A2T2NCS4_CORCC|nr:hypothetical protein BS50DRAFT_591408 [Corynespora cassiicola Philippines]